MSEPSESSEASRRARVLMRAKKYDEAVALCEQALQADVDDTDVYEVLATVYFLTGKYDAAITNFTSVTRLAPRRPATYINMGAVYNRMGEFAKAVESLRRGLQLDKNSSEGYYNLGIAYRQLKEWKMAVPAYREAIRLDPRMHEAYQNLGNVYTEMGNHQQAASHYKKALEIKPDFQRAQVALERSQKVIAEEKLAKNPFGRLVQAPPESNATVDSAQAVHRELSDDERLQDRRAIHTLLKSLKGDVQHVADALRTHIEPAVRELSMALAQQGATEPLEEALIEFRKAKLEYAPLLKRFNATMQSLRDHEARMQ